MKQANHLCKCYHHIEAGRLIPLLHHWKMIEIPQTEELIVPNHNLISLDAADLLNGLIQPIPTKRLTLSEIKSKTFVAR